MSKGVPIDPPPALPLECHNCGRKAIVAVRPVGCYNVYGMCHTCITDLASCQYCGGTNDGNGVIQVSSAQRDQRGDKIVYVCNGRYGHGCTGPLHRTLS